MCGIISVGTALAVRQKLSTTASRLSNADCHCPAGTVLLGSCKNFTNTPFCKKVLESGSHEFPCKIPQQNCLYQNQLI